MNSFAAWPPSESPLRGDNDGSQHYSSARSAVSWRPRRVAKEFTPSLPCSVILGVSADKPNEGIKLSVRPHSAAEVFPHRAAISRRSSAS